jgi:hypothetical protein
MDILLQKYFIEKIVNEGSLFFTSHQINLIKKKKSGIGLKKSEEVEYSRSIIKKLRELENLFDVNDKEFYFNSKNEIRNKTECIKIMRKINRKFRDKKILISGSFLYNKSYNDIDIFVVLKYDKDDYIDFNIIKGEKLHINYIKEQDLGTLFFKSIASLSVSNFEISNFFKNEYEVRIDNYISMFLELLNDIKENPKSLRKMLRTFILEAEYISTTNILNSKQISNIVKVIESRKNISEVVANIFKKTLFTVNFDKKIKNIIEIQKDLQDNLAKSFKQHSRYYLWISDVFKEVLKIGCDRV